MFCLMVMPVWGQVWAQESESGQKESSRKKKSEIKALLGGSWNTLNLSDQNFETTPAVGFMVGATYKQGRFFYWELGLVYDNSAYTFGPIDTVYADGTFSVKSLDVPITGGINLLSLTSKLVGLRDEVGLPGQGRRFPGPDYLPVGKSTLQSSRSGR